MGILDRIDTMLTNFFEIKSPYGISYPRLNSLVRFSPKGEYEYPKTGFYSEEVYLYLGEVVNMPGHGIFVGRNTQKVYYGYHIEDFEEIPEEEV